MEPAKVDGLIVAGLAHNAYRLLSQYEKLSEGLPAAERYEVTLHLAVLQLLLTNAVEYARNLSNSERSTWLSPVDEVVMSMVKEEDGAFYNTFPEARDASEVLTHVRNALSHPRMKVNDPPTTGYTTESDADGAISHVTFTDSPDYNSKGTQRAPEHRLARGGLYDGPVRIFTIRLTVGELFRLTRTLAGCLSGDVASVFEGEFPMDRVQMLELAG